MWQSVFFLYTCMHLADAFMQIGLHCIKCTIFDSTENVEFNIQKNQMHLNNYQMMESMEKSFEEFNDFFSERMQKQTANVFHPMYSMVP